MWAAALVTSIGFLLVALLTHWSGVRAGGVVVVPLLAVYTLINVWALPLFVVSLLVAYAAGAIIEHRTLVFGYPLTLLLVFVGAIVPLLTLAVLSLSTTPDLRFRELAVFGSILPGITAYNLRSVSPDRRWLDVQMSIGLFTLLVGIGALLVSPETASRFGTLTPQVLFGPNADIAQFRDAVVPLADTKQPIPRAVVLLPFALGIGLVASLRQRLGLRLGVVALPLVAVFTYYEVVVLALFGGVLLVALAFETAINRQTLLYGRVLLGVTLAVAMLVALGGVLVLPIQRGTSALFAGMLAGFGAHNLHLTAQRDWTLHVSTSALAFALSLGGVLLVVPFTEADPIWRRAGFAAAVVLLIPLVGGAVARFVLNQSRTQEERILASFTEGDQR